MAELESMDGFCHWSLRQVEAHFQSNGEAILFEQNGSLLGQLFYKEIAGEFEIFSLTVSRTFRRKGLASRLLGTFLQEHCGKSGVRVSLEVSSNNEKAIYLYQKFGFCEVGRRKAYYSDGTDGLILEWICS